MNSAETKKKLRREIRAERQEFTSTKLAEINALILSRIKVAIDWSTVKTVHVYVGVADKNEVATLELIHWLLEAGKRVLVPFDNADETTAAQINDQTTFESDTKGYLVPHSNFEQLVELPSNLDVIIVPSLAVDAHGYRLGGGKGYYDRLLATFPQAQRLGIGFEQHFVEQLPREPHDLKLNQLITEKKIHSYDV